MRPAIVIVALRVWLVLAGCAVGPDYQPPKAQRARAMDIASGRRRNQRPG